MLLWNKIIILIAFVLVTIARNAVAQSVAPKIVDGTTAAQGRYPYMVALRETKGRRYIFCAGTLITPDIVLTAAHCRQILAENVEVLVNPFNNVIASAETQIIQVAEQIVHPEFGKVEGSQWANDVMILKLEIPVENPYVMKLNNNPNVPISQQGMDVLGWGTRVEGEWNPSNVLLEQGGLFPVNNQVCNDSYKASGIDVLNGMLCADNDRSCQGDSGGPLLIKGSSYAADVQVGIISWAIGCGSKDYPGVHARVSFHYNFIVTALCNVSRETEGYFSCIREPTTSPTKFPTLFPSQFPTQLPSISPSTSEPTYDPTEQPSILPSKSPAPSNPEVDILLKIVTDNWANEIKWTLFSNGEPIVERGYGYYSRKGTYNEVITVERDNFYKLVVYDSVADGICCGQGPDGSITLYFGTVEDSNFILGSSDGRYTDSVQINFYASEITAPPTASPQPSSSPTDVGSCPEVPPNGCSVCPPGECITNERAIFEFPGYRAVSCRAIQQAGYDGIIPLEACTFFPALAEMAPCGCAKATLAPSPSPSESALPSALPTISVEPTTAPTITPAPTDPLEMLVVLYLDQFPSETGWEMEAINDANETTSTVFKAPTGTYTNALGRIERTLSLFDGERYRLILTDQFGDGFCCGFGNGNASVYFGTEELEGNRMAFLSGNFRSLDFQIFDPAPFIGNPPTPAPAGGTPLTGICFPGDVTCEVLGKGEVQLKDLQLGDRVLVEGQTYEKVYSFGHRSRDMKADYLELSTASRKLEISKKHMIFVEGGHAIPASSIKLGDKIETISGKYDVVLSIKNVVRQGAYAPFTTAGTIIVNGLKASTFVAFQESETLLVGDVDSGVTFQSLAHLYETPHRIWCSCFSSCTVEYYTDEGVSLWVSVPYYATKFVFDQHPRLAAMLTLPLLLVFLSIGNPGVLLIATALIAFLHFIKKLVRCKTLQCER
mmetsp:Transcript_9052/g.13902  ORF Transcript_9052/g.13902 Transcript_9052/m.13902 type:complete len:949 (-) Transcript_9052:79-2925(-)